MRKTCLIAAMTAVVAMIGCAPREDKPRATDAKSLAAAVEPANLLDSFDGQFVWAADSADDQADIAFGPQGATEGKSALQVAPTAAPSKFKVSLRREVSWDLTDATALALDIESPGEGCSAALALRTDPGDFYQETPAVSLKEGANRGVTFRLDRPTFKSSKTKWENNAPLTNAAGVTRITILIFLPKTPSGTLRFDRLVCTKTSAEIAREWRPQIVNIGGRPRSVAKYESFEMYVVFRASYSRLFYPDDLAMGARFVSPSGRVLNVRGFFAGVVPGKEGGEEAEGKPEGADAEPPFWGPWAKPKAKDSGKTGGKADGRDAASAAHSASSGSATAKPAGKADNDVPIWAVRFTPDESGRWTYDVFVRNRVGEARTHTFGFICNPGAAREGQRAGETPALQPGQAPASAKGFVRVSRTDPRQLEYSDGSPFYIVGQNVAWAADYEPYLKKIAAYRGNTCRVWLCPWGFKLERQEEAGTYDWSVGEQLDKLFATAEALSIKIILCFEFHGHTGWAWNQNPCNVANGGPCARAGDFFVNPEARRLFRRKIAYAVSRWGHSTALLAWELLNEADLAGYDRVADIVDWHEEMAAYLKSVDPYAHPVTASTAKPDKLRGIFELREIDIVQGHVYSPDVDAAVASEWSAKAGIAKPFFLGEYGGGWEAKDDQPDERGVRLHAALWLSAVSPGCGACLPWWWDTYIEPRNLYGHFSALTAFLSGDDRRDRAFKPVEKVLGDSATIRGLMDERGAMLYVFDPRAVRNPEKGIADILSAETPVTLSGLLDGPYKLEFWDTFEGKVARVQDVAVEGGKLKLLLPATKRDFAVKLTRVARDGPGIER